MVKRKVASCSRSRNIDGVYCYAGLSISGLEGGSSRQDVGYRDYGGHLASRQLAGRPAAEHLELDTFGRPMKRAKVIDERGLAANGPLQ
jgi:hypothetical protein